MYSIEEGIQHGLDKLGYQSLRDGQQEVIEAYLKGFRCVFLFSDWIVQELSLCYEIAPYILYFDPVCIVDSVCIVVSPLISLMQDQVALIFA
jgi:superfamily II DNA helicase RecQ